MHRLILLFAIFSMTTATQLALAGDLRLTTSTGTTTANGRTTESVQTMLIHDQRSRSLQPTFSGYPLGSRSVVRRIETIWQCDTRQLLAIDLDNGVYSLLPLPGQLTKDQMTAALTRAKANPRPAPKETLTISTQVTDMNEQKMAFGRLLRHFKIHSSRIASPGANTDSREEEADGWFVEIPEYDQLDGCNPFPGHKGVRSGGVIVGSNGPPNYRVIREVQGGPVVIGYPADVTRTTTEFVKMPDKTTKTFTSRMTETIRELSMARIDPALFDAPAGFARVANIETGHVTSWSYRLEIAWAKLKASVVR